MRTRVATMNAARRPSFSSRTRARALASPTDASMRVLEFAVSAAAFVAAAALFLAR